MPCNHWISNDCMAVCADDAFGAGFDRKLIQYERSFRPTKLVRIVEPLSGLLVARRLLHAGRLSTPRAFRGTRTIPTILAQYRLRRAWPRARAAVSDRLQDRFGGERPAALDWVPRRATRARRQRSGRTSAIRCIRRNGACAHTVVPGRSLSRSGDA